MLSFEFRVLGWHRLAAGSLRDAGAVVGVAGAAYTDSDGITAAGGIAARTSEVTGVAPRVAVWRAASSRSAVRRPLSHLAGRESEFGSVNGERWEDDVSAFLKKA